MANGINEQTKVTLPITKLIVAVLFLLSLAGSAVMYYNSLANANEKQNELIKEKVDRKDFERHSYMDSVKFEVYFREVKKDLRTIKRTLKVKEEEEEK